MIVLFGGSFNPPTVAHRKIIEILSKKYESVIIVPNGNFYNRKSLVSFNHRKKMLELLTNDLNNIIISDIEQKRKFIGTFQTLRDLNHPVFACGDDCLKDFETWININELLEENKFLIFTRTMSKEQIINFLKNNLLLSQYIEKFSVIEIDYSNISSSNYKSNKNDLNLTKEVKEYIKKNNLYVEDMYVVQ